MTATLDQRHERRLRRSAHRQGYRLHKLRDDDGYQLTDLSTGGMLIGEQIAAGVNIGYDLNVIEDWLRDRE